MDLIDKELMKINFVVHQYNEEKDIVYEQQTKAITDKLKKIIDSLASQHLLISANSVRKIKHYSVISRVKEGESFKEKLIRNNLCNIFFPVLVDGYDSENGELINSIKERVVGIDDLIGIKILTDLNVDCKKMFELVSSAEFKGKAIAENIILNEEDLKSQPQMMQNGLDIYKIKGKYDKYNFELQIKSKIISAWGDMEHSIFYKDYYVSPVRDSTQASMNHIGKLLFDIDDFLESIRNANKLYKEKADVLAFSEWFDERYNQKISAKIGNIGFKVDGISDLLYAVYKYLSIPKEYPDKELKVQHFELEAQKPHIAKYVEKRNKVYDLKILEGIVISWILPEEGLIEAGNIDEILDNYLKTLRIATASQLIQKNTAFELDEMLAILDEYYEIGFDCECNEKFLLNLNTLILFFHLRSYIFDVGESLIEESYLSGIAKIIFVFVNKGSTTKIMQNLLETNGLQSEIIKSNLVMLRENLSSEVKRIPFDVNRMLQIIIESIN